MSPLTNHAMPPSSRKVFNTFIDDGALISGVKRNSRDSVKKMIKDGCINLFVPLHTLERLRRLAKGNDRASRDATEALRWLDEITSISDRVHLQGGFELYENWDHVEQYMLPETLLSMETESLSADSIADDLADIDLDNIRDDASDKASLSSSESLDRESMKSSPISAYSAPSPRPKEKVLAPIGTGRPSHKKATSDASAGSMPSTRKGVQDRIPYSLRPFFNHIIWRIHHEQNGDVPMESFILITNDSLKQTVAKRFGIRAKNLEQLRRIVAREAKDYKSRTTINEKPVMDCDASTPTWRKQANREPARGTEAEEPVNGSPSHEITNSDDEDEIVFKRTPPTAPQAMAATQKVFDPNHFGRRAPSSNPGENRGNDYPRSPSQTPRGRRGGRGQGTFRGRGGSRGAFAGPTAQKNVPRQQQPAIDLNKPIDPDSFSRPVAAGRSRGRGSQRRLWEPS